ncbi:hypothetical protein AAG906_009368 [Vitis piasezkii]
MRNNMCSLCKLINLEELDLSGNGFEGSLPACLNNLTSLRLLDLSRNDFLTQYISLSYNHFEGSIYFGSLFNHSRLEVFELSSNNKYLKVETENPTWSFLLFQLKILRLSNCTLNWPSRVVPNFLLSQHDLRVVDLSYNHMTGDVPTWLLDNNTKLEYLSFESNSLTGVLDLGSSSKHSHIASTFHRLYFSSLEILNLSGNALQGYIPSSMGDMEWLGSLDLSNNNLSGQLPKHMMMGCISLEVLKLSNNSLHGTLPTKSNLTWLSSLSLDNNDFWGEISRGFLNSSFLRLLDVSSNSLMGQIPDWIGDFSALETLILSRNYLDGAVPTGFCKLNELRFLDLSHNKIGPTLPPCANLTNMKFLHLESNELTGPIPHVLAEATSLVTLNLRDNKLSSPIPPWISLLSKLRVLLLKGNQLEESIPLHFPIPPEIGNLSGIHTLNLSYNQLTRSIPQTFSNLKEIECLDLSHNRLTGQIPPQMVIELNFLTVFTVSHNNLSGQPLLCGLPLKRSCTPTSAPPAIKPLVSDNRENSSWEAIFLWSFGGSFGVAFLGIVAFLYLNSYYRELLFYFIGEHVPFLRSRVDKLSPVYE